MTSPLDVRFRTQAAHCRSAGSPLTAALLDGAADELGAPGPVRDLLAPLADDPPGSVPPPSTTEPSTRPTTAPSASCTISS